MHRTVETIIGYALGAVTIAIIATLAYFWIRTMLQVVGELINQPRFDQPIGPADVIFAIAYGIALGLLIAAFI